MNGDLIHLLHGFKVYLRNVLGGETITNIILCYGQRSCKNKKKETNEVCGFLDHRCNVSSRVPMLSSL